MYAKTNGLKTYYEVHGEGAPLILLHGGLETCQMWAPFIPALASQYQVITPDSRGHGRTDNPTGEFSFALLAADTADLIQALGLQRPFVAGYSNGGRVALQLAMTYPGLACGYMFGGIYHTPSQAWMDLIRGLLGFDGPGRVDFERVAQTSPQVVQDLQAKHGNFRSPDYWKSLLVQVSQCWWEMPTNTPADYAKIVDPSLFWCGDRDVFCPPEQSLTMYRMVTGAELAVIPNADHFSMIGQVDLAVKVLLNFMRRCAAAG